MHRISRHICLFHGPIRKKSLDKMLATLISTSSSAHSQEPKNDFGPPPSDDPRSLYDEEPQKDTKFVHAMPNRTRPNCAVYGAGLSSTGALAIPALVKSPEATHCLIKPRRIAKMNVHNIKYVAAGCGFSLFASKTQLYGSGLNNFYQISGPKRQYDDLEKMPDISDLTNSEFEARNEADMWYLQGKRIMLPEDAGNIRWISAGRMHSVVLTEKGKIFCFGSNTHGQCGADPTHRPIVTHNKQRVLSEVKNLPIDGADEIIKVHASCDTTFALSRNGRLFAWGLGTDGQLGNGNAEFQWQPELVKGDLQGETICHISGSTDTLTAVSKTGELFIWGQNEYGQLGVLSDEPQVFVPRQVPFKMGKIVQADATGCSCIVCNTNGEAFTWGYNVLGFGPKVQRLERPMQLDRPLFTSAMGEDNRVIKVFASNCTMGALTESGHLFTWGANRHGNLALGHPHHQYFPFQVSFAETVKQASLGPEHSLFITNRF